jgi:arylsulfatase/arylsulfatase A
VSGRALLAGLLLAVGPPEGPREEAERPNVILVVTDDQGYGDFGFTGNADVATPHLDAMAGRSAWLSSFYVTPVCATTRASLMTGRYHPRTGVLHNGWPLEADEVTLAEHLGAAGYATGLFGKWHLGAHHPSRPMDQGFEESLAFRGGILRELEEVPTSVRYTDPMLAHNGEPTRASGYATDVFFDAALEWIGAQQAGGRPFFAYLATNAPHGPFDDVPLDLYEPVSDDATADRLARVHAMIAKIDHNIGKLFERLAELELTDDTLVLFLTDNGPSTDRWNAGLRGSKSTVLEGGVRVPFLAHWPGRLPAREIAGVPGACVDLVPTVLEACGVEAPGGDLDGTSLLPLLEGRTEELPERYLFMHARSDLDWKRNYAVRARRWKLVRPHGYRGREREGEARLYDLAADPLEARDLALEHPDIVRSLQKRYDEWVGSMRRAGELAVEPGHPVLCPPEEDPMHLTRGLLLPPVWVVEVDRPGRFDLHFRFAPVPERGHAYLRLKQPDGEGYVEEQRRLQPGDADCSFSRVDLTPGRWRLEAELRSGGAREGSNSVWRVEVDRRR